MKIVSLITLTTQTLQVTKKYVDKVMHAKDSTVALIKKLEILDTSLKYLDVFLKSDNEDCYVVDKDLMLTCNIIIDQTKLMTLCDKLNAVESS